MCKRGFGRGAPLSWRTGTTHSPLSASSRPRCGRPADQYAARFDEFSSDELSHLAAKARLPEKVVLDTANETVARFREHWNAEKQNLALSTDIVDAIEGHLKIVPIAWSCRGWVGG
jgi:hypothetical protein